MKWKPSYAGIARRSACSVSQYSLPPLNGELQPLDVVLLINQIRDPGGEAVQVHAALLLLHHLLCDVATGIHPAACNTRHTSCDAIIEKKFLVTGIDASSDN